MSLLVSYHSRSHDAAAPPVSWEQPPPVLPTWGSQKSDGARAPWGTPLCPQPQHFLVQQRASILVKDLTAQTHPEGSQQPQLCHPWGS